MDSSHIANPSVSAAHSSHLEASSVEPGALDDLTIMRYAPFYRQRSNGGVEQYLRCLNYGLLQRHRLTVLQVHRVSDLSESRIEVENVGKGRIFWIPVAHMHTASRFSDLPRRARFVYDQTLHSCQYGGNQMQHSTVMAVQAVLRHGLEDLRHRTVVLSDPISRLLVAHKVNLLLLHGLTYDANNLVLQANKAAVPFVLINHFDNELFSERQLRKWLPYAAGIGSVSGKKLPDHVRDRCVNLSDGIDTDFFAPHNSFSATTSKPPVILLPALIKPGKGHKDLLQAARILMARDLDFQVCCAGAVESPSLCQELRQYAAATGLEHRIVFLGELRQEEIRDYYARSSVVVLPTSCEGLGRCLLEAQAMRTPVVAYDSGGVGEAILPDVTGFLVNTGDVDSLADKIGFLLTNEAERVRMGTCGRQFVVRNFSSSALIQRHELFYIKALSDSNMLSASKNRSARVLQARPEARALNRHPPLNRRRM